MVFASLCAYIVVSQWAGKLGTSSGGSVARESVLFSLTPSTPNLPCSNCGRCSAHCEVGGEGRAAALGLVLAGGSFSE